MTKQFGESNIWSQNQISKCDIFVLPHQNMKHTTRVKDKRQVVREQNQQEIEHGNNDLWRGGSREVSFVGKEGA